VKSVTSARHPARRPPFTLALVGLVVLLTGLTGGVIGGLAWREQRERSRLLVDSAMAQAGRLTAAHAGRVLEDAESVARLGPQLVEQGQLDPGDERALERFTLAVLRAHPSLSWVSYGDRDDRFVGAWRDTNGTVYLNRSRPVGGRIRLEEDRVLPDGRREAVRRSDNHGYRPSTRPYFRSAVAARALVWTEPYEFYAGGGMGITCAAPLLQRDAVRGVFTVDFSLDRLAGALEELEVSPRGRVFIATRQGALLVGRRGSGATRAEIIDAELAAATARAAPPSETAFAFEHQGARYLGRAVPLHVGELRWLVDVIVPEGDYTDRIDAQARVFVLLGVAGLLVALVAGVLLARWIARPLRELAQLARRIRQGELEVTATPRSRDEIGVLTRAMGDMAKALRDRDFIRATFGRYVSPELAERALRDRERLQLGGELREVTMLMSDLRGFSELSESLGAAVMIDVLNRYFASMTPVIVQHGGVIDEIIGDAIFVLFGAPFARPDDPERAVRCAWAMQEALTAYNAENQRHRLPELSMGIGLHIGTVVAGTIGSPERVKYGVVGPAVNLLARIQALTVGGEILISGALLLRVASLVSAGPGRAERVKGASEPVTVHRVLGVAAPGEAPVTSSRRD
jgi:sigma-B regulation protein RsbU (phosphoserine phosphatase)